jgi:hypothetical protein
MTSFNLKVSGVGFNQVHKALNNLAERIENPDEKFTRRIGDTVIEDIDRRFMTRGYGTWPPLKPSTIRRKKGNSMVLIDTGTMYASTRYSIIGPGSVRVSVPYGGRRMNPSVPAFHQEGTSRIPQRKIIDNSSQQLKASLVETTTLWILDMIKAFAKDMSR